MFLLITDDSKQMKSALGTLRAIVNLKFAIETCFCPGVSGSG